MKKKINLVIVATVAREILVNYSISPLGAWYAAIALWRGYQSERDGQDYPGQAAYWAVSFSGYFRREGTYGGASLKRKVQGVSGIDTDAFWDMWKLVEHLDQ